MNLIHKFPKIICLFTVGFLLAGCGALQPAPTATPTPVPTTTLVPTVAPTPTPGFPLPEGKIIFEMSGGKKFAGTINGKGETAILLANMSSGGEAQWSPFVEAVDQQKFTVVTFSYLQDDYASAAQETNIVLQRLRESGYKRVVCIGASLGVTSCASIAQEPEMIGIVLIAGPNNAGSLDKTYPKLFIAGGNDQWAIATQKAYDLADEPKTLVLFPGNGVHGTGLFYSPDRDKFLKLLVDFVNSAAQ